MTTRMVLQWVITTSGVDHNDFWFGSKRLLGWIITTSWADHNDWLIGYMDHNDYDSRGVVGSRAVTTPILLLKTLPFIGPTSGCRISRPLVHTFLTLTFYTIIIGSLGASSLLSIVPRNPFYKYVISCITHRIRRPFVPSSHRPDYLINLIYHKINNTLTIHF